MRNIIFNYATLIIVYVGFPIIIFQQYKTGLQVNIFTYTGLFFIIFSIVFFTMARIQLGSSFQASAKANNLVTRGIYKKIRNPIYIFGFLLITGLIISIQKFYLLPIMLVFIFMQLIRIKQEEKVLTEKFGDEYLKYKKDTWF